LESAEPGDGFDEDFLCNILGILRMKNLYCAPKTGPPKGVS
jgi:hypothetical protein